MPLVRDIGKGELTMLIMLNLQYFLAAEGSLSETSELTSPTRGENRNDFNKISLVGDVSPKGVIGALTSPRTTIRPLVERRDGRTGCPTEIGSSRKAVDHEAML